MLSLRKPQPATIRRFLASQEAKAYSYAAVGATATCPPAGYRLDRTRITLGEGAAVFEAAKNALRRWQQFRLGWVDSWPVEAPIRPGEVVAVIGKAIGLWWLNACRIVYVINDSGPICRFGFAYGTLPDHVQRGEERFLIEWDQATNQVCYDIMAFSRPNHWLTRLGDRLVRRKQKQFGRESAATMCASISESASAKSG